MNVMQIEYDLNQIPGKNAQIYVRQTDGRVVPVLCARIATRADGDYDVPSGEVIIEIDYEALAKQEASEMRWHSTPNS